MIQTRRPVIGITCIGIEADGARPARLGQNRAYTDSLIRAGAAPALLPQTNDLEVLRALYQKLDGLLLPGGEDIDPKHYGEAVHENCGKITAERDETELALARWATKEGKPLMAICRGIQVINVALGGSLYQDIETQVPDTLQHAWSPGFPRDRRSHPVTVTAGSRLAAIVGAASLQVNSMHHQAIKHMAPGLGATAHAPDGLVEAVEVIDHPFALAVQWHPEELAATDAASQHLFNALILACRP
jgi:putative glutamine amidotransferase